MNLDARTSISPRECPRCAGVASSASFTPATSGDRSPLCPACALTTAFREPLARFAGYEILEELGRGGMGQVYLAYHTASGRVVALKTPVRAGGPSAETLRRFHSEAEAVAALDHPGIVPIYEVGEEEGLPYFTMKFAEGGNLAGQVSDYTADPRRAAALIAGIAEAVHHAHMRGILHRDLKPQNILLDEHGHAYVSDFGVSRWLGRDLDFTHTGSFIGSPNYMAPEQTASSSRDLTVAADVFSLGAILYHLLGGRPPFAADSVAATLRRLGEGDLLPLPASVPRDLEAICLHALAPAPGDRYSSAQALATDLQAWLAGRAISIRRLSPVERLWRLTKRNPILAGLSVITFLAIAGGGAATFAVHHRALVAETARANAAETLARDRLRVNLISEARALRLSGIPGQRTRALARLREAWDIAPSVEIRNEAIAALALPDLDEPAGDGAHPATPDAGGEFSAALSPDRKAVTVRDRQEKIVETISLPRAVTSLAWSPDREQLILGTNDKHVSVWNRATHHLDRRLSGRESVSTQLAVSHHGNFVADVTAEGALRIWQLSSGEDLLTAHFEVSTDRPPQWSPDDSEISFQSRENGGYRRVNIILPSINRLMEPAESELVFEDPRTIDLDSTATHAAVTTETEIRIWDLSSGTIQGRWKKTGDEWALARFLPGDKSLLIGGWSSDVRMAPVDAPDRDQVLQRMPGAFLITLGADGGLAGFVDSTDEEFELLKAPFTGASLHVPQPKPFDLAIDPKGRWIATSTYGGKNVRVLGLPGLRPLAALDSGAAARMAVSPTGDRIYVTSNCDGAEWWADGWKHERDIRLDEEQRSAMFSGDNRLLAIETRQSIRLHDLASGREVARLPTPGNPRGRASASFTFSRDSSALAVQTSRGGILLWNLPVLRRQLAELGMDW